jgi:hypothetical protein
MFLSRPIAFKYSLNTDQWASIIAAEEKKVDA